MDTKNPALELQPQNLRLVRTERLQSLQSTGARVHVIHKERRGEDAKNIARWQENHQITRTFNCPNSVGLKYCAQNGGESTKIMQGPIL